MPERPHPGDQALKDLTRENLVQKEMDTIPRDPRTGVREMNDINDMTTRVRRQVDEYWKGAEGFLLEALRSNTDKEKIIGFLMEALRRVLEQQKIAPAAQKEPLQDADHLFRLLLADYPVAVNGTKDEIAVNLSKAFFSVIDTALKHGPIRLSEDDQYPIESLGA